MTTNKKLPGAKETKQEVLKRVFTKILALTKEGKISWEILYSYLGYSSPDSPDYYPWTIEYRTVVDKTKITITESSSYFVDMEINGDKMEWCARSFFRRLFDRERASFFRLIRKTVKIIKRHYQEQERVAQRELIFRTQVVDDM